MGFNIYDFSGMTHNMHHVVSGADVSNSYYSSLNGPIIGVCYHDSLLHSSVCFWYMLNAKYAQHSNSV